MNDARFAAILAEASRHLGARYVWGGAGPSTFDCSGFIHWVFSNALSDWTHGRTTAQGYFNMSTPVSQENARPGDLVFFHSTHSGAFITHVGIYVGNGQMIHTGGNPAGVEFVSINTPFWQRHFHAFARP
jgi:cell wall-associated NlpC family hydrolase